MEHREYNNTEEKRVLEAYQKEKELLEKIYSRHCDLINKNTYRLLHNSDQKKQEKIAVYQYNHDILMKTALKKYQKKLEDIKNRNK